MPSDPRLMILNDMLADKIEDLFYKLDANLSPTGKMYAGACPIHGGSNPVAFNLYPEGDIMRGFWVCNSKHCHTFKTKEGKAVFAPNLIGFTRGILSRTRLNWSHCSPQERVWGFHGTVNYLCDFLKVKLDGIKVDHKAAARHKFLAECYATSKREDNNVRGPHRSVVRSRLTFPAHYFVDRGFSEKVLDKFDVGVPMRPKAASRNRVVVPVYDRDQYLIGFSGRSIFNQCSVCAAHHMQGSSCPMTQLERDLCSKWRHSNFNASAMLYNFYGAEPYIKQSGTAILVEGPGDVWRLEEAGIHNAIAMFGSSLHDDQQSLISKTGALSLILLLDSDDAGITGTKQILEKFRRNFNFYTPNLEEKDVGDMKLSAITDKIKPILDRIKETQL